jgi:hypothetical protein
MYSFRHVYIDDLDLMKLSPLIYPFARDKDKIGGTWLETQYPGCAYQVSAHNRIAYLGNGFTAQKENDEDLTG